MSQDVTEELFSAKQPAPEVRMFQIKEEEMTSPRDEGRLTFSPRAIIKLQVGPVCLNFTAIPVTPPITRRHQRNGTVVQQRVGMVAFD